MNERIRELANKSFVVSTQGDITTTPLMIENFAALLLQECLTICKNIEEDTELSADLGTFRDGAFLCKIEIAEKFGVDWVKL